MTQEFLLYTQNISAATAEIASKGGQITQQLSSELIVANIPKSINLRGCLKRGVKGIKSC